MRFELRVAFPYPPFSSVTKDKGLEIVKNTSCQASPVGQEGILMGEEQRIGILYAETNPCQAQVLLSG